MKKMYKFIAVVLLVATPALYAEGQNTTLQIVERDLWINGVSNKFSRIPISFKSSTTSKDINEKYLPEELYMPIMNLSYHNLDL